MSFSSEKLYRYFIPEDSHVTTEEVVKGLEILSRLGKQASRALASLKDSGEVCCKVSIVQNLRDVAYPDYRIVTVAGPLLKPILTREDFPEYHNIHISFSDPQTVKINRSAKVRRLNVNLHSSRIRIGLRPNEMVVVTDNCKTKLCSSRIKSTGVTLTCLYQSKPVYRLFADFSKNENIYVKEALIKAAVSILIDDYNYAWSDGTVDTKYLAFKQYLSEWIEEDYIQKWMNEIYEYTRKTQVTDAVMSV